MFHPVMRGEGRAEEVCPIVSHWGMNLLTSEFSTKPENRARVRDSKHALEGVKLQRLGEFGVWAKRGLSCLP